MDDFRLDDLDQFDEFGDPILPKKKALGDDDDDLADDDFIEDDLFGENMDALGISEEDFG